MKSLSEWLMRDRCRNPYILRMVMLVMVIISCHGAMTGRGRDKNSVPDTYHADIQEFSLADNLLGPEIPRKQIAPVEAYQKHVALNLKKQGVDVELMRDRQIVVATIPAVDLFGTGGSHLNKNADRLLERLAVLMRTPDKYKILVVAHSDNTGSEEYLNALTGARANAVAEWLVAHHVTADNVVPYGLGADEPRMDNSSRSGRDANRRVELYLVPGPVMIAMAKGGKL